MLARGSDVHSIILHGMQLRCGCMLPLCWVVQLQRGLCCLNCSFLPAGTATLAPVLPHSHTYASVQVTEPEPGCDTLSICWSVAHVHHHGTIWLATARRLPRLAAQQQPNPGFLGVHGTLGGPDA